MRSCLIHFQTACSLMRAAVVPYAGVGRAEQMHPRLPTIPWSLHPLEERTQIAVASSAGSHALHGYRHEPLG